MQNNDFIKVSMEIILLAGDARNLANDAFELMLKEDTSKSSKLLQQAKSKIVDAHKKQTNIIQNEAKNEYSNKDQDIIPLLFIHAQDTIMTITSEINMIEKMMVLYRDIKGLK